MFGRKFERRTIIGDTSKGIARKVCLSRQRRVCRDKYLSCQKLCPDRNISSRVNYVCRNKTFVATHILFREKNTSFVATKACVSRQKHVFVAIKRKRKKRRYLWQLPPMIEGNSFKSHAILTFRARAAIAVQPVTVVTLTVVGSVHVDTTLLTIVCVRRTFVYVCERKREKANNTLLLRKRTFRSPLTVACHLVL